MVDFSKKVKNLSQFTAPLRSTISNSEPKKKRDTSKATKGKFIHKTVFFCVKKEKKSALLKSWFQCDACDARDARDARDAS